MDNIEITIKDLGKINTIKDVVLTNLKEKFNKREILALISSVNSILPDNNFYITKDWWSFHFEETCLYEPMMISQFLEDNEDLETFKKTLSAKLDELDLFSKYILFKLVFGFWGEDNKIKDLNKYVKDFKD